RPAGPGGGGDEPHRENVIVMTDNDHSDGSITATCAATVTKNSQKAQRGHKFRWHIENDHYNKCDGLDENKVELRFEGKGAMAKDNNPSSPLLNPVPATGDKIDARVHANKVTVPDGKYKYTVY